jgi:NADH:ubiquinone oxidoreductase subunit E
MATVAEIVKRYGPGRDACIKILQEIQAAQGYLSAEASRYVTAHSQITARQLYGVATFYERFRFQPRGRHMIRACQGTACHVNGAKHISRAIQLALQIKDGATTPDGLFTLETVACLGCCSLAPVMMVDEKAYGRLTPQRAPSIIRSYQRKARAPQTGPKP